MLKQKKTWVLVADGTRARIFKKKYKHLDNALGQDIIGENLKNRDHTTDKPGRTFESGNYTRHAYEPRTDWHQYQKELFAKELCHLLEAANETAEFDELIIISPPKTLGNIREHLNKHILPKIKAEIHKDVTKFNEQDLVNYLEKEL